MVLAEQHRLALRVSADEPAELIAALEAAALAESDSGWRVVADAPATLAGSLSVTIAPFGEDALAAPAGASGNPGTLPDDPFDALPPGPAPDAEAPADPAPRDDDDWLLRPTEDAWAVYLAEVDMTEEGLAALDRDLRRAGRGRAGFAALADPLDSVLGDRIMLIPADDVMWWYHPPREWSRRTLVPVVVERK
jgi:hypothetical protein